MGTKRKEGRKKEGNQSNSLSGTKKGYNIMEIQTFDDPSFQQRRDINEFGVFLVVPHQEFPARGDVPKGPVINVPTILKYCHVLFLFVPSTLYKPHPA